MKLYKLIQEKEFTTNEDLKNTILDDRFRSSPEDSFEYLIESNNEENEKMIKSIEDETKVFGLEKTVKDFGYKIKEFHTSRNGKIIFRVSED